MAVQHLPPLKPVRFLGGSLDSIRDFPKEAKQAAGDQLLLVQAGNMPEDWKAMPDIGSGVFEIRIHKPNEYRVLYVAKFPEAVYVLDAFEKKTRKTPQKELEKARKAYAEVLKERRS
jgi:phage-related protein